LDPESRKTLTRLIDTQRVAALGTLRDGAPFVSLVPFIVVLDATVSFYLHISRWPNTPRTSSPIRGSA
jgi:hypothetical protein